MYNTVTRKGDWNYLHFPSFLHKLVTNCDLIFTKVPYINKRIFQSECLHYTNQLNIHVMKKVSK